MRLPFYFFLLSVLLSCQPEPAVVETNQAPLQENQEASKRATSKQALILRMATATAAKGQTVCLPVTSQDFRNLIGFQFTMRWDSAQLEFQEVRKFGLPGYGPSNFGDRFASRGYLSTLWTEATLKGKSVPDGTTIFEVCFKNLADSGTTSPIRFADGPTTFEIIAADMAQWKFRYVNGAIHSK